jgi:geranylgeranyl pyrophosphate synthase
MLAGADDSTLDSLHHYSEAIGVAYQIGDDLEDYLMPEEDMHRLLDRPSIVTALATEQASGQARKLLQRAWQEKFVREHEFDRIVSIFRDLKIDNGVRDLMREVKTRAIDTITQLKNPALKGFCAG